MFVRELIGVVKTISTSSTHRTIIKERREKRGKEVCCPDRYMCISASSATIIKLARR
jgi:hypothetical protein